MNSTMTGSGTGSGDDNENASSSVATPISPSTVLSNGTATTASFTTSPAASSSPPTPMTMVTGTQAVTGPVTIPAASASPPSAVGSTGLDTGTIVGIAAGGGALLCLLLVLLLACCVRRRRRRRVICLAEAEGKAAKDDTTTWTFREKTNQRNSLLINEFYEKCSLDEHSPNRQIEASQETKFTFSMVSKNGLVMANPCIITATPAGTNEYNSLKFGEHKADVADGTVPDGPSATTLGDSEVRPYDRLKRPAANSDNAVPVPVGGSLGDGKEDNEIAAAEVAPANTDHIEPPYDQVQKHDAKGTSTPNGHPRGSSFLQTPVYDIAAAGHAPHLKRGSSTADISERTYDAAVVGNLSDDANSVKIHRTTSVQHISYQANSMTPDLPARRKASRCSYNTATKRPSHVADRPGASVHSKLPSLGRKSVSHSNLPTAVTASLPSEKQQLIQKLALGAASIHGKEPGSAVAKLGSQGNGYDKIGPDNVPAAKRHAPGHRRSPSSSHVTLPTPRKREHVVPLPPVPAMELMPPPPVPRPRAKRRTHDTNNASPPRAAAEEIPVPALPSIPLPSNHDSQSNRLSSPTSDGVRMTPSPSDNTPVSLSPEPEASHGTAASADVCSQSNDDAAEVTSDESLHDAGPASPNDSLEGHVAVAGPYAQIDPVKKQAGRNLRQCLEIISSMPDSSRRDPDGSSEENPEVLQSETHVLQ